MKDNIRWTINDVVHTDDTEGHGCPQADDGKKCESSEFKRNLNGGPQADGVGESESSEFKRNLNGGMSVDGRG